MSDPASHAASAHEPPPPEEPKTPMWLPAVGAALFIAVGLWWAVTPKAPPPPEDETPASTASVASAGPRPAGTPGAAGSAAQGGPGMDNAALQKILERLPKQ